MTHLDRVHVNNQAPAPRTYEESGALAVHSIFYTIQGEGPLVGRPAVFVRLYGCNLQCPGCDTDYTSESKKWSPHLLALFVTDSYLALGEPLVVITGGEPFRQNVAPFIGLLQEHGCTVQIETNGTLPLPGGAWNSSVRWHAVKIICSPKTGKVNKILERFITAYKYVISAAEMMEPDGTPAMRTDGLPIHALGHPAKPRLARPPKGFRPERVYVQPADPDPDGHNLAACIASVYKFGYTLCLQTHKIIGVP